MIQKCIEANPGKFALYAKVAMVIGWILLIVSGAATLQYCLAVPRWDGFSRGLLHAITPAFLGMVFLVIGQFLRYELGLEKQPGWFFRNGFKILRVYAVFLIGVIVFQYAGMIGSLLHGSFKRVSSLSAHLFYMLSIAKGLLLWGSAGVAKMLIGEIRKEGEATFDGAFLGGLRNDPQHRGE